MNTKNNFIRHTIAQNEVILKHLPTREMVDNPFIKFISRDMFSIHVKQLRMHRL